MGGRCVLTGALCLSSAASQPTCARVWRCSAAADTRAPPHAPFAVCCSAAGVVAVITSDGRVVKVRAGAAAVTGPPPATGCTHSQKRAPPGAPCALASRCVMAAGCPTLLASVSWLLSLLQRATAGLVSRVRPGHKRDTGGLLRAGVQHNGELGARTRRALLLLGALQPCGLSSTAAVRPARQRTGACAPLPLPLPRCGCSQAGVQMAELGLQVIRGDNMCVRVRVCACDACCCRVPLAPATSQPCSSVVCSPTMVAHHLTRCFLLVLTLCVCVCVLVRRMPPCTPHAHTQCCDWRGG
jgi:hypothetical protein